MPEVDLRDQDLRREEHEEADDGEQDLRAEIEDRKEDVDAGRFLDADDVDHDEEGDREDAADRVVGPQLEDRPERGQVVGHEERRDGDGDDVVEHQRPAGAEAHELVERVPGEARRAAGLREHRGGLGVGEGGGDEQEAGEHEDDRSETHRRCRDDAERVVDRRADVAVGGAEQGGDAQHLVKTLPLSLLSACHEPLALFHFM